MLPTVESALNVYRTALQILDDETSLTTDQALEILRARNALQNKLVEAAIAPDRLKQLSKLDSKLKRNANRLIKVLDLDTLSICRNSLSNKVERWWWYLEAESALNVYCTTLQILDDETFLTADQALEILRARDALQNKLETKLGGVAIAPNGLKQLSELDSKLKQNANRLIKVLDLDTLSVCRNSLSNKVERWWWYLEKERPHPLDRYDGVFNGLSFASRTVSVALLINI